MHFGSVTKMKAATVGELAAAPGMNPRLAEVVHDHLHDATRN
jgi:excinuclease UvrABC nuclease subunit